MSRHSPDDPLLSVDDVCTWLRARDPQWVRLNYRQHFPEVTYVGSNLYRRQSVIADFLERNTVTRATRLSISPWATGRPLVSRVGSDFAVCG